VCHLVEGDVLAHHASQTVYEGREGDGTRSITVAPHFCPSAGEVKCPNRTSVAPFDPITESYLSVAACHLS